MSASKKLFRIQHRASIEYFLSFIFLLQSVPLLKEKTISKIYGKKTLSYELLPTAKGFIIWIYLMHIRMSINSLTHKPLDYKNNGSYWAVIKRHLEVPQTRIDTEFLRPFNLFPLNSCRGLGGHIINYAVDSAYLIGDSR